VVAVEAVVAAVTDNV